jgi:hypothetical protein
VPLSGGQVAAGQVRRAEQPVCPHIVACVGIGDTGTLVGQGERLLGVGQGRSCIMFPSRERLLGGGGSSQTNPTRQPLSSITLAAVSAVSISGAITITLSKSVMASAPVAGSIRWCCHCRPIYMHDRPTHAGEPVGCLPSVSGI